MKTIRLIIIALTVLLLLSSVTACNKQLVPDETEKQPSSDAQRPDTPDDLPSQPDTDTQADRIATVEEMARIDGVLSVERLEFIDTVYGVVAYQLLCQGADGTQLAMEIILPDDYAEASMDYPVLLYYPQIGWTIDDLAISYTTYGYIVIRPYPRGYGQSEGSRDRGGDGDLSDALTLLNICDAADFIRDKKVFLLGSSEGATIALRLYAEDTTERFTACAVVDVVTDLHAYGEMRGEGITELHHRLIGKTYEEAPEEYELRSPLYFAEKLDGPLLLLCYTQSPFISVDSIDQFYEQLCTVNPDVTYHKLDAYTADFTNPGYAYLMSWLRDMNENG